MPRKSANGSRRLAGGTTGRTLEAASVSMVLYSIVVRMVSISPSEKNR
jgi:hypothetical protein